MDSILRDLKEQAVPGPSYRRSPRTTRVAVRPVETISLDPADAALVVSPSPLTVEGQSTPDRRQTATYTSSPELKALEDIVDEIGATPKTPEANKFGRIKGLFTYIHNTYTRTFCKKIIRHIIWY